LINSPFRDGCDTLDISTPLVDMLPTVAVSRNKNIIKILNEILLLDRLDEIH